MPSTPAASSTQKALLEQLKDLAQTDAINSGNQITALNGSIAKFENGKILFQQRYTFWDKFITDYELERKYLDGQYIAVPIAIADFDSFLAQDPVGRLYNLSATAPTKFSPKRIEQFDGSPLVTDTAFREASLLDAETTTRQDLLNGFITASFPTGFTTTTILSPTSTTLGVSRSIAVGGFPIGVRFSVQGNSSSAILTITGATATSSFTPFTYTLNVKVESFSFSAISSGAIVLNNVTAFTNTERTSKVAAIPARQSLLNGFIDSYSTAITNWKNLLQLQKNAIVAQTNEDAPDTAYLTGQDAALTQLNNWLTNKPVSNDALSVLATLNTDRKSANTARVTGISSRIVSSKAYDERYKYADRLYNLIDGAVTSIKLLTQQRNSSVDQQALSNTRAANYSKEAF